MKGYVVLVYVHCFLSLSLVSHHQHKILIKLFRSLVWTFAQMFDGEEIYVEIMMLLNAPRYKMMEEMISIRN